MKAFNNFIYIDQTFQLDFVRYLLFANERAECSKIST